MVVNLSGDLPVFQYNDFEVFMEDLELVDPESFLGYIPVVWPNDTSITSPTIELQRIDAAIANLNSSITTANKKAIGYLASIILAPLANNQFRLIGQWTAERKQLQANRVIVEQLLDDETAIAREAVQVTQLQQSPDLFPAIKRAGYTITPTTKKSNVPAFAVPAALISAAAFLVPMR